MDIVDMILFVMIIVFFPFMMGISILLGIVMLIVVIGLIIKDVINDYNLKERYENEY